jgi:chromate reductase
MRILGISGSLRRDSYNTRLLRTAAQHMPPGVELEIWDGLKAVPPYDEDDDRQPAPPAVQALREAIEDADALLIATPEYNGSVPGQLKNAIDWASRPAGHGALRNKPSAVIGATMGMFGAVWAQADLRRILATAGARVVEGELPVAKVHEAFTDDERLRDEPLTRTLEELLARLVDEVQTREPVAA